MALPYIGGAASLGRWEHSSSAVSHDTSIDPTEYESWNYESDEKLVASKIGEIADEEVFLKKAGENFTLHYRPLIPWVNRLRREVFPTGGRWKKLEPELYSSMKKILCDALKDPEVFQIA